METDSKMLALLSPGDSVQELLLKLEGVEFCYVYKNRLDFFSRCIKRMNLLFPFDSIAFSSDYLNKNISNYDIIILDETIYPDRVIKNIRKKNKHCKIIYWMWNTVEYSYNLRLYNRWKRWNLLLSMRNSYNFIITSFDEGDCKKYNLTYNNQIAPFFSDITIPSNLDNSIFFFGQDKGRLPYIKRLHEMFTKHGYACNFNVVPDARKKYNDLSFGVINKESFSPYKDIVKSEMQSKALLEVLQKGQEGLTWRALESLFYKKKLITNLKKIKEYNFYRPTNISVLGIDNIDTFDSFMNSHYEDVPKSCIEEYTFKGWLSKILK